MEKEEIIKLIKKLKRAQRRDALRSEILKGKLFSMNQMVDAFDSYLDSLIEEVNNKNGNK